MSKKFIQVSRITVTIKNSIAIATGVIITLFTNETSAQVPEKFIPSSVNSEQVVKTPTSVNDNAITLQLSENVESLADCLNEKFKISCSEDENCTSLAPAHQFLMEVSSSIGAEKATLSCNSEYAAVTHSLRLPHEFMLTLTKLMETMDDTKVMFNLMRNRKLLISDVVEVSLLKEYIGNVINKLG